MGITTFSHTFDFRGTFNGKFNPRFNCKIYLTWEMKEKKRKKNKHVYTVTFDATETPRLVSIAL